jgi:hypothetical protein
LKLHKAQAAKAPISPMAEMKIAMKGDITKEKNELAIKKASKNKDLSHKTASTEIPAKASSSTIEVKLNQSIKENSVA